MLKNKLIVSLVLLACITGCISLQSRQIGTRRSIQQTPPPGAQAPIQQPAPPQVQQNITPPAQPVGARRQTRQQNRQPRRQANRRARPRQAQQQQPAAQMPIQQPIVAPQQVQQNASPQARLSDFDFGAASVLPTFINQNGKKYLILSREAHGSDKGTYDDFGGKRDLIGPKNNQTKEPHPVITAAREFFEEAILMLSTGLSLREAQNLIEVKNNYTEYVVANGRNVTYITDFTAYTNIFFAHFYDAFNTTTSRHSKEKDRIAVVGWDELKIIVNISPFNSGVTMDAQVLNPLDLKWYKETITLRGFFVKKLRPFWMDKPYQQGQSSKIRFY